MAAQIIEYIALPFTAWAMWFLELLDGVGLTAFFLGIFFIVRLLQVVLSPVIGGAGSDRARRSRDKEA